jgi:hypothetical protein
MTAIRPERLAADQIGSEKTGPEQYAPKSSGPERLGEVDQAAVTAFEGEIREFVRRDVATLRRQRNETDAPPDPASENLNALIRRIAGASMEEIDRVIIELQGVRDMLRSEGERVSRELAGYASLSHASMTAMKVISDSLKQWKNAPINNGRRSAN